MLLPRPIPPISRSKISGITKLALEDLTAEFSIPGWTVTNLGPGEDPDKDMYGMAFGDPSKPCIFITACVHGNEWPSTYAFLEFAKLLSNPSDYLVDTRWINSIRTRYSFYGIPVGNPWSYVQNVRDNKNGVNINRDYGPFTQKETQVIKAEFDANKPVLFLDLHDVGFTTDSPTIGWNKNDARSREIVRNAVRSMSFIAGREIVPYPDIQDTMGHVWCSTQMGSRGRPCLGFLCEAYRSDTNDEEVFTLVNDLYLMILYADIYFRTGVLNPTKIA